MACFAVLVAQSQFSSVQGALLPLWGGCAAALCFSLCPSDLEQSTVTSGTNAQPASKHGTMPLRVLIICAWLWSAQWRVQQAPRRFAHCAGLCSLSDASLRLWKEEVHEFTGTDGATHAYSVCASPYAGLLPFPLHCCPTVASLLCRCCHYRRLQTSGGCWEAI